MTDTATNDEAKGIENLTIGQFISALRIGHLWAVIGAIATLIALAFGIGYKVADIQSSRATSAAIVSQNEHEFMTRYLRYMIGKEMSWQNDDELSGQKYKTAKVMFVDLIAGWWKDQQNFDGSLVLKPQIIRKGWDPTDSQIRFADNTTWPIPPEIKQAVLEKYNDAGTTINRP